MWNTFSYYRIAQRAFSASECARIIDYNSVSVAGNGLLPNNVRDSRLFWLSREHAGWVHSRLWALAAGYEINFDLVPDLQAAQLTRYDAGQHYDWHIDLGAGPASLRKLSLVIELAHADEGGGLQVFPHDFTLPLEVGDAVLFPSFIPHRAVPVTRGSRWSLVMWFLGKEPFK